MVEPIRHFEFRNVAERLSQAIHSAQDGARNITIDDLEKITNGYDSGINLYPSKHRGPCCDVALFISLNSARYAKSSGHLKFRKALEKLVQHTQGACSQTTQAVILITDSWDVNAIEEWRGNLEQIQRNIHLETYLITNTHIRLMPI